MSAATDQKRVHTSAAMLRHVQCLGSHKGRVRLRNARAVIVAAGVVGLLASACGGGSSPGSSNARSAGSSSQTTLAFSLCMRTHDVSQFPDQLTEGKFPTPQDLGVSNTVYQVAMNTCKHLLPNDGQPTQVASPQLLNEVLRFARCMRSHGFPSWPDPASTPSGPRPYTFNLQGVQGFDPRSHQVDASLNECQRLTDLGVTGPPPFGLQRPQN
jgi:hypothetical protein